MGWIDGLDMHIVNLLGASFRESYPDKIFPTNRPTGSTQAIAGSNMLPEGYDRRSQISPLISYPYRAARDSLEQLRRLGDPDACHAYKLNYINPVTGGSAMPTISTSMQDRKSTRLNSSH